MKEESSEFIFQFFASAFGVIVLFLAALRSDLLLSFLSIVFLVLMNKTLDIEPEPYRKYCLKNLKGDLFFWCFFPLLLGAIGATGLIDMYFYFVFFRDIAFTTLAGVYAFMLLVNLEYYTDFRANRPFTLYFVVMVTMTSGAIIGVSRFLQDVYLGTIFISGNTHMMVFFIIITILSVAFAVNIYGYIKTYEFFPISSMTSDFRIKMNFRERRADFLDFLNELFGKYDRPSFMLAARVLQICILATVIYGVYMRSIVVFSWSAFSLMFAISPDLFARRIYKRAPSVLYLWIAVSTFIFAFGRPMGFYTRFPFWSGLTHCVTGTLVGVLVFSLLVYLNWLPEDIYIPPYLLVAVVLVAIFPIGVIWEISEFYVDTLYGRGLQEGVFDTTTDLLCNFLGTVISMCILLLMKLDWTARKALAEGHGG